LFNQLKTFINNRRLELFSLTAQWIT